MRRILVLLFMAALSTASAAGALPSGTTAPPPPKPASSPVSHAQTARWEYLVVSFGKTYFSDALNAEDKQSGLSKLRTLSEAGILIAQEATLTQADMDKLGRYGWELVGIVGAIGGDQKMVFKRPYDPDRSANEAALIAAEGKALSEAEQKQAKAALESPADMLVDLDAAEKEAADLEARDRVEQSLREIISGLQGFVIRTTNIRLHGSPPPSGRIEVLLDGTAALLKDNNKYRRSEAQSLANRFTAAFSAAMKPQLTRDILESKTFAEVILNTSVLIDYSGKANTVYISTDSWYWKK